MDLKKIEGAIENLCDQLSDLTERVMPACTSIEDACKTGTVAAEIGKSLAALLTVRKLYESGKRPKTDNNVNENPIDWAKHL